MRHDSFEKYLMLFLGVAWLIGGGVEWARTGLLFFSEAFHYLLIGLLHLWIAALIQRERTP